MIDSDDFVFNGMTMSYNDYKRQKQANAMVRHTTEHVATREAAQPPMTALALDINLLLLEISDET